MEPGFQITHIDAVVIAETASVCFHDLVVVTGDLVFADIGYIRLGETAVGRKFLDVAVGKSIYVKPLVASQQIVNGFIVDTL